MKSRCLFTATLACGLFGPAGMVVAEETNHWSFDVVPYLWAAGVKIDTSLPSMPPSTPPGVDRFDTSISAGAMLAAQAQYRSLGLFVDFAWLRLDTKSLDPSPAFSAVDLKSDFIHTSAMLTYRLPLRGKFHTDLLAGARLWNVNEDLTFTGGVLPGFKASGNKTWVDPLIGVALHYDLSKRWSLVTKGTVGGFGVSSDVAWEVFSGANYHFTDWCSGVLGYRYLYEKYDRNGFNFTVDTQGFLLGVGFHF